MDFDLILIQCTFFKDVEHCTMMLSRVSMYLIEMYTHYCLIDVSGFDVMNVLLNVLPTNASPCVCLGLGDL